MSRRWLFTSESVTEGHPDKVADQISDAVLDEVLRNDPSPDDARVACETLVTTGMVVVAGEIFEHVEDLEGTVAEVARVLKPGGTMVCDTINDTRWARFSLVTVGERMPGGPPPHCHDPRLFVSPQRLKAICRRHGIELAVRGLRFSVRDYAAFLLSRGRPVRMVPTRSLAGVYQGKGTKR